MKKLNPEDILSIEQLNSEDILSIKDSEKPKSTLESIEETASDVARSFGGGVIAGGLEEAIAGGKAGIEKLTSPEEKDFSELYRKYLEIEEQKSKEAEERSPYLTGAAKIAGSMLPGFLTGGATMAASGGRAAAQLAGKELLKAAGKGALVGGVSGAAIGAVESGFSSEKGKLIGASEEEQKEYFKDLLKGAAIGGAGGALLGGAAPYATKFVGELGKKAKQATDFNLTDEIKTAYEMGKEGKGLLTKPELTKRMLEEGEDVSRLTNKLIQMEETAANRILNPLKEATKEGKIIESPAFIPEDMNLISNLITLKKIPDLDTNMYLYKLINNKLNPLEANELRKKLKIIGERNLANKITESIEKASPGYSSNLKNFKNLREATTESIIQGGKPTEFRDTYLSDLSKPTEKLYDKISAIVEKLKAPGDVSKEAKQTIYSEEGGLIPSLKKLAETKEGSDLLDEAAKNLNLKNKNELIFNIGKDLEDSSSRSVVTRFAQGTRPEAAGIPTPSGLVSDVFKLGRSGTLIGSNVIGQIRSGMGSAAPKKATAIKDTLKFVYNLPETSLGIVADKLMIKPGYEKYAKNLKDALAAGDNVKKEAVLFSLMQNPGFRKTISDEFSTEESEE